jgi:hypothetical protein
MKVAGGSFPAAGLKPAKGNELTSNGNPKLETQNPKLFHDIQIAPIPVFQRPSPGCPGRLRPF